MPRTAPFNLAYSLGLLAAIGCERGPHTHMAMTVAGGGAGGASATLVAGASATLVAGASATLVAGASATLVAGASGEGGRLSQPAIGDTEFAELDVPPESARPGSGGGSGGASPIPREPTVSHDPPDADPSFARGALVRELPEHRIAQLASGPALQIIDLSDVQSPRVEGTLNLEGFPIELHVVGDRALVLMNMKQYWGSRGDIDYEWGGRILSIDIRDRAHPIVVGEATAPGWGIASILKQRGSQLALYVTTADREPQGGPGAAGRGTGRATVTSYDVSADAPVQKSEQQLPDIQDVVGSGDFLFAFLSDYSQTQPHSAVTVLDIASDARMEPRGTLQLRGQVSGRRAFDVRGAVLRVVSVRSEAGGGMVEHHIETFSLEPGQNLARLDDCAYETEAGLVTALFNAADVLIPGSRVSSAAHAYTIDAQGHCLEQAGAELPFSWFLRAVRDDTRLITVTENLASQPDLSDFDRPPQHLLSLYERGPSANPALLTQVTIDLQHGSYEQPSAIDVLENAVSVNAPDGTLETGLILLTQPWLGASRPIQIVTFSDHTLTRRGDFPIVGAQSAVALAAPLIGAFSSRGVQLFGLSNPDSPQALGSIDTTYAVELLDFGDHVVGLKMLNPDWSQAELQLFERKQLGTGAAPISTIALPHANRRVNKLGDLLLEWTTNGAADEHVSVTIHDYSEPSHPRVRGSVAAVAVGNAAVVALPGLLVFAAWHAQQQELGPTRWCTKSPPHEACNSDMCSSTYYSGTLTCSRRGSGPERCSGSVVLCQRDTNVCERVDTLPPDSTESCEDLPETRWWNSYEFSVLDVRDPDKPAFSSPIEMPADEMAASLFASGHTLYVNFSTRFEAAGDESGFVKHFVRMLDWTDPEHPIIGEPINIPGEVIAVDGDSVYSVSADSASSPNARLARLAFTGGHARLQAIREFDSSAVVSVVHDTSGHLVVTGRPLLRPPPGRLDPNWYELSVIDPDNLDVLGAALIDSSASFVTAAQDRSLYAVPGGMLLLDYADPAHPIARRYFPGVTSSVLFDGAELLTSTRRMSAVIDNVGR
jgi:hypothetical protein